MSGICGKLNTGVIRNCEDKSTGGIEQVEIVLINRRDIDYANTKIIRNPDDGVHRVERLALLPDAKAYSFEGIAGKRVLSASYQIQTSDFIDTFSHTVNVAIYNQCEESLVMLNQFVDGAEVVAVIENKSKGASNECAFHIYGLHKGLKVGDFNYNSNENNGIVLLPLSSKEPDFEPYAPYVFLETDYAQTKTKIESFKG